MAYFIWNLLFTSFLLTYRVVGGITYHILPSPDAQSLMRDSGPTLSQLAANSSNYLELNTTLIFFGGNYSLQTELFIANTTFFSLVANDSTTTQIICNENSSLTLKYIIQIYISSLEFIRCSIRFELVDDLILEDSILNGDNAVSGTGIEVFETKGVILRSFFKFHSVGRALTVTSSNFIIINCNFMENSARVGGAISSNSGGNVTITNCMFANNKATGCVDGVQDCEGGALSVDSSSSLIVCGSTFLNNTSDSVGGAINVRGQCLVTQNTFQYNQAFSNGGAMFATFGGSITVGNSTFYDNQASQHGGAAAAYNGGSIIVGNSSFYNNKANGAGGAIFEYNDSRIIVDSSIFQNNTAGSSGNACVQNSVTEIFDGGALSALFSCNITINKTYFFDNRAIDCDGGAISVRGFSQVCVENSNFHTNEAGKCGGAIYAFYESSIDVQNSFFDNNSALHHGGALCPHIYCNTSVSNCSFSHNVGAGQGGAINTAFAIINVNNGIFKNNKAKTETGGAVYVNVLSTMYVNNSRFINNQAVKRGGAISADKGSKINVSNSYFTNNSAVNNGGAIGAIDHSTIITDNCNFSRNTAKVYAGAVYAYFDSRITVHKNIFDSNTVGRDGGAIYVYTRSNISVNHSQFINNNAINDGGCLYALSDGNIIVDNTFFSNSTVGHFGGVIFTDGSKCTLQNSCIESSFVHNRGGAVYTAAFSDIIISNISFSNNTASNDGGVVFSDRSNAIVERSTFSKNNAYFGGVIYTSGTSNLTINNHCVFDNNTAFQGGVIFVRDASFVDQNSTYIFNSAQSDGGVIYMNTGAVKVTASSFTSNSAGFSGGVMSITTQNQNEHIVLKKCNFQYNKAENSGGIISMLIEGLLTLSESTFSYNSALHGGVLHAMSGGQIMINHCNFTYNTAKGDGGVIYSAHRTLMVNNSNFNNNTAYNKGGAFCILSKNNLIFLSSTIVGNEAHKGGAVYAENSTISMEMHSKTAVTINMAKESGGGFYLHTSELVSRGNGTYISENSAVMKGGGLHAVNSSILVDGTVHVVKNRAKYGGGASLETYTKINNLKGLPNEAHSVSSVYFISNKASYYGGAIYVDDETNSDMCTASLSNLTELTECFSVYTMFHFLDNFVNVSGSVLFGGLLDRCTVNSSVESDKTTIKSSIPPGVARFQSLSNITDMDTVDSHPVRTCFCRDSKPDCKYQPSLQVQYGKTVKIKFIAYNQVSRAVNATIRCSLTSSAGGLGCGQDTQFTHGYCSELQFDIFSPFESDELLLKAMGPCLNSTSQRTIKLEIICTCPIGFQKSNDDQSRCQCLCDPLLQQYDITKCNITTQSIIRSSNLWITYINHNTSSGYLIHSSCPSDYCRSPRPPISINLNLPDGSDVLCAPNRTGILCGTCKSGYSVSLGSSHCISCPRYWPGLLAAYIVVFILAGIALVALLLAFNLTVAVGTLNAIVFYANIVAITRNAFFLTSGVNFASVFISWLNLDLGFDSCLFDGMDMYVKTWLQLAFPAYIFFLVVLIIKLRYHFTMFGRLIGRKDPVATLATLILLSYTKILNVVITAFSSATLNFPDGSKKIVWLSDTTVKYLGVKHSALFIVAIFILLVGITYTIVLFSWQWVRCNPRKKMLKWVNLKFQLFLDTYYAPYIQKHRYWTGLLLFIRVNTYLISAFSSSGDPRKSLLSTIIIITCLILFKAVLRIRLYKVWFIDAVETLTYFNLIVFTILILYTVDASENQTAIAHVSVGITFVQLILVISYHVVMYTKLSRVQETALIKGFVEILRKKCGRQHANINEHITCQSEKTNPAFTVVALSDLVSTTPEEDENEIEITARDNNDTAILLDRGSKIETLTSKSGSESTKFVAGCTTENKQEEQVLHPNSDSNSPVDSSSHQVNDQAQQSD